MKNLNGNQMEILVGGTNGRNCLLAGAGVTVGVVLGIATGGAAAAAWYAFGGASWLTGIAGDCF